METARLAPVSLKIVAGLFILTGVCSVIEVALSLLRGHVSVNLGVLELFAGLGLLRFSRGWRTCALVFLWITLVGAPIVAIALLAGHRPASLAVFGQGAGHASSGFALAFCAAAFLLSTWQYHVLTRPDIRALFGLDDD